MSRLKHNLQIHGPAVVGILLFILIALRYYSIGLWKKYIAEAAISVFGLASVFAPEEVSSWTGRYGWTYESFWTYPATWVRFFGFVALVGVLAFGFR